MTEQQKNELREKFFEECWTEDEGVFLKPEDLTQWFIKEFEKLGKKYEI